MYRIKPVENTAPGLARCFFMEATLIVQYIYENKEPG